MQPLKGFSSIVLDVVVIKTSPKRFIFFLLFFAPATNISSGLFWTLTTRELSVVELFYAKIIAIIEGQFILKTPELSQSWIRDHGQQ